DLSPEGVSRLAAQVVAQARLAPEDPESLPEPPLQKYAAIPGAFDPSLASADPRMRAEAVRPVLDAALQAGLTAAGLYQDEVRELTRLSSAGSAGTHKSTSVELSMTLRKPDGSASAWAGAAGVRATDIDSQKLASRAAEKARQWVNPEPLPPGK